MIRVFILEDHEIFREGVKKILSDELGITVIGEEKNGTEFLKRLADIDYDVLLMDLNIPGRNGVELIEEVKRKKPQANILVLSINSEDVSALPSLNAGASGYLCKDAALKDMVHAINKIVVKGRYLSTTLAEQLAFDLLKSDSYNQKKLSSLESNIAFMMANGKSAKSVADELGLSVSTIFTHRRKIFEKLNIHNNIELAHYVMENKILNY
jgi:two-component system, NarL family, invasion response regulator UvrY